MLGYRLGTGMVDQLAEAVFDILSSWIFIQPPVLIWSTFSHYGATRSRFHYGSMTTRKNCSSIADFSHFAALAGSRSIRTKVSLDDFS